MGADTKDQTPDLRHSMCRDPNGSWNTLCFQGTRILVILLCRILCEIPVLHGPHTEQVLRKGGVKVQWVWESCTEEVVLDFFFNRFDPGGGNSRQGKCLSKDVM